MSIRSIPTSGRIVLAAAALLTLAGVSPLMAQDADPPGRVARLSFTQGAVSIEPAGMQDWAEATLNRPLTTGDKLWTDQGARAELDMGAAVIRLGESTGFSFLNLDDRIAQMNVTAGTAIVHVRDLTGNQTFEIDTPNLALTVQSPGDYRVEVSDSGDATIVKVSNGEAEVNATGQSIPIRTQQAYTFTGTDQVSADAISLGAPDPLDQWSLDRDHREEQAQSNQYVAPEVAGAGDLDDYGTWSSVPDYGYVWTPTAVAVGWAPYHFGRWVWVSPWGWTWVDDAPWGFAPFHYGRWAYLGSRWCWVPGPRRIHPVYAPAMVAWVGAPGAGVAVVGGGPAVGWFPLGPREVYVPGYRVSRNYVRNVNVSNTTIVNNTYITNVYENKVTNITYANRNAPGAVTAVSQNVFTSAQPVSGRTVRLSQGDLDRFGTHGAAPAIAPVRQSVLGVAGNAPIRRPPPAFVNRPVVARVAPPPAPASFDRQQAAIRANGDRPIGRAQLSSLQPQTANPRVRIVPHQPIQLRPGAAQGATAGQAIAPGQNRAPGQAAPGQPMAPPPSLQDRERALHATPLPPGQQSTPPASGTPRVMQSPLRNDRPPSAQRNPVTGAPQPSATPPGAVPQNPATPQNSIRQNDMYRMPQGGDNPRPVPQARPLPEARPIPQARPLPQARPIEQPTPPPEPPRAVEPPRPNFNAAPVPTPVPNAAPRAIEPPRQVAQPRPPAPAARAPSPPPQRAEERRNNRPDRPDRDRRDH
ncbi:MAG TPA: DUF6600 domain-containing protein [Steroidobacteraceae bacterium]|nr:DUF6600 domain-containing protein [Steroidobacteraceae bacterium]